MVQPLEHKVAQRFAPKKDGNKDEPHGFTQKKMEKKMSPKGSDEAKDAKTHNFFLKKLPRLLPEFSKEA